MVWIVFALLWGAVLAARLHGRRSTTAQWRAEMSRAAVERERRAAAGAPIRVRVGGEGMVTLGWYEVERSSTPLAQPALGLADDVVLEADGGERLRLEPDAELHAMLAGGTSTPTTGA